MAELRAKGRELKADDIANESAGSGGTSQLEGSRQKSAAPRAATSDDLQRVAAKYEQARDGGCLHSVEGGRSLFRLRAEEMASATL